jgi:subtilisin family serine protease
VKNSLISFVFIVLFSITVYAQEQNRYMVFFDDKSGTGYSLDAPEAFLSIEALERRYNQNIPVDSSDLPVSQVYTNTLRSLEGVSVFFTTKWMNGVLIETSESQLQEISNLLFVRSIEYVAPGVKLSDGARTGRNSRNYKKQEVRDTVLESEAQNEFIGVDEMHEEGYKGEDMSIAIFDSGFEYIDQSSFFTHLFEDNLYMAGRDFIRNSGNVFQYDSHGSKVISCISAYTENVYSGTAPEAEIVLCITEDVSGEYRIEEYNWLFAAEYADSLGVDIINSSVGYSYFNDDTMDYSYNDLDGNTAVVSRAARMAASKGMLVVVSNGNEGNNAWTYLNAPADADSILAVGSVTYDEVRSNFASYGPTSDGRIKPDISALGSWARVVYQDEITYANGTSFSTPMVAGLAAGFWQAFPKLSNMEVIEYLKMSSSQSNAPDTLVGYGIPNFTRAYNQARIIEGEIESKFVVFPNPVTNKRLIYLYSEKRDIADIATLAFYDLKGSQVSSQQIDLTDKNGLLEVDVTFLTPGTYILNYITNTEKQKIKLVVL